MSKSTQSGGFILVHCEWNLLWLLLFGRIMLQTGQREGAKIGFWEVGDPNIHRVDYGGHGRAHGGCVTRVPIGGYATMHLQVALKSAER